MLQSKPYIDIHTHKTLINSNIAIENILVRDIFKENSGMIDQIQLINQHPQHYYSAGIHPWYLENWETGYSQLEELAEETNVIAIGECGLDKIHGFQYDKQKQAFHFQISLSENIKKPLIIHCVKKFNELVQLRKATKPKMTWIVHGFNESMEIAKQCIDNGMVLSFGKSLMNEVSKASRAIQFLANDNMMLETDESDLTIEKIYLKCAEIKSMSLEQLKFDMVKNFERIFYRNNHTNFFNFQDHS